MKPSSLHKYKPFPAVELPQRTWPTKQLTQTPLWCSVDLRDGNQALPHPMTVDQKLEFFQLLCKVGFKEIEIGFPSASDTEFSFCRRLIEDNLIPEDVTIQVLVQTREPLIQRTFKAIRGAKKAIVHIYNSTSTLQRKVTFGNASREEIKAIAVEGATLVKELAPSVPETEIILQYSPESFSDTELDFAAEVCNAVIDIWQPTPEKKMVINLPDTVQWAMPNIHADQIEWMCNHLHRRDSILVSLHTHNDRGTGVAATELGLLAGADRVEGTLFGNGERTGNLDITTVALNLNSHGIATGLDFSNLNQLRLTYERVTGMTVPERHPYAGELVFTAFSGSHQDAINKGFNRRENLLQEGALAEELPWEIPYLTIDPKDIGRNYEALVRINSQSGKGGVAYVLKTEHGFDLPKTMHPQIGKCIYNEADKHSKELTSEEIVDIFFQEFVNLSQPIALKDYQLSYENNNQINSGTVTCKAVICYQGKESSIEGSGNGPINALVHILEQLNLKNWQLKDYRSQALRTGSDSDSAAYIQLQSQDDPARLVWGCGVDSSIELAGLKALICAANLLNKQS